MSEKRAIDGSVYSITNDLRKELEIKIENAKNERLPKYVFKWAVVVLSFVLGMFYRISYMDILEWRKESMEKIYKIETIIPPTKKEQPLSK